MKCKTGHIHPSPVLIKKIRVNSSSTVQNVNSIKNKRTLT